MVGEVVFVMFNGFDCSKRLSSARWIVVCLRFVHLLFAKTVPSLRHRHFGTLWARAAALGGTPYRADPNAVRAAYRADPPRIVPMLARRIVSMSYGLGHARHGLQRQRRCF